MDQVENPGAGASNPWLMRLSQGQLNLLEACPRRFQQVYLDQLASPSPPEQQARMAWGSRFHLLMQQRELGLPIDRLLAEDPPLQDCFTALFKTAPDLLTSSTDPQVFRQSEHPRTLEFQGYSLTAVYDLVMLGPEMGQIVDWKTYDRPPKQKWLARNWQTRLYLFLLTETTDYAPEQLSMTYWFVQTHDPQTGSIVPQSFTFAYTTALHQQTQGDLSALLNQLTQWLDRYRQGEPFPQVLAPSNLCATCSFVTRCEREQPSSASFAPMTFNLAEIEEVPL
ncbi:MAG: PD-(D/E)XK nuclease family protein [Leptolyngbyaceae cyanobacterium bins.59]|nr:PD-(D/E)XK nuclease family protein [Leptolyngbyaceae cyanobacterium bins.59]